MEIQDTVNVYLCRDQRDCEIKQAEYAAAQQDKHRDVKKRGNKLVINGKWNVLFTHQAAMLDGMYINEINVSTALATAGDIKKITHMLNMAREGRLAMKNEQQKQRQ